MGRVLSNLAMMLNRLLLHMLVKSFRGLSLEVPKPPKLNGMPYGPAIFVGVCVAALGVHLWGWEVFPS